MAYAFWQATDTPRIPREENIEIVGHRAWHATMSLGRSEAAPSKHRHDVETRQTKSGIATWDVPWTTHSSRTPSPASSPHHPHTNPKSPTCGDNLSSTGVSRTGEIPPSGFALGWGDAPVQPSPPAGPFRLKIRVILECWSSTQIPAGRIPPLAKSSMEGSFSMSLATIDDETKVGSRVVRTI